MDREGKVPANVVAVAAILLLFTLGVAGCAAAPSGTKATQGSTVASSTATAGSSDAALTQALKLIKEQALVVPRDAALSGAKSVPALIGALDDRFARYMDPKRFAVFSGETESGSYGGVGIRLADDSSGRASVVSVVKGSPAESAGIRRGDVIIGIDGVSRNNWSSDEVPVYVKGPVGTSVTLKLSRPGVAEPVTVKITRSEITGSNVTSELIGGVGYIRILAFDDQTASQVRSAVAELSGRGAKAWVVDLRGNPGGPIQAAVDVTSVFLKSGEVVRSVGRDATQTYSVSGQATTAAPVVVLVDGFTDSAAEVVAAALRTHQRATLVGTKTPGDGSIQTVEKLADGSGITFTVARLVSPDGKTIAGVGVTPETTVPMTGDPTGVPATDAQLKAAIKSAQAASR